MSTTSLKLSDDLKQRAARAAASSGLSPHAFMVHAIEQAAINAERRASFKAAAHAARDEAHATGQGYEAEAVHDWLKARASGKTSTKPKATTWRG